MVLTANSTYTTITIQSDNLTSFSGIDTVTLYGKINCAGTYSDTIVEADVTLATGTFTVDIATLFGSAPLADGVYSFTLEILNTDDTVDKEFGCLFVDNDTKCLVADCIQNTPNMELQTAYVILSRAGAGDCNCDCEALCNIYQRVTNELAGCQGC